MYAPQLPEFRKEKLKNDKDRIQQNNIEYADNIFFGIRQLLCLEFCDRSRWQQNYWNFLKNSEKNVLTSQIVSWFYYWRAAWNIVSRHKAFPDEPLPTMEFLQKDFDTCVLTSKYIF